MAERNDEKNNIIEEKNEEIKKRNIQLRKNAEQKVTNLKKELYSLDNLYKETFTILEKYYEEDIIFPKYRNLIAISSFYEYFISGRCLSLEGHEGAYNIFENEVRQNIIICKLDEVISQLEKIEQTQYMLYHAIADSNKKTEKISKEVLNVAHSLEKIENNSLLIEHNTQVTAKNTECIKWIEYFRK